MIVLKQEFEPNIETWAYNHETETVCIHSYCPCNYPLTGIIEFNRMSALLNLACLLKEGWYIEYSDFDIFTADEIGRVEKDFREWCELWHGDCPSSCEIKKSLRNDDSLANLWSVAEETDDFWEESFETFFQTELTPSP